MKFFLKYLAPLQMRRQNNMKYRSKMDGLRALAVVQVILFHAGFELFQGLHLPLFKPTINIFLVSFAIELNKSIE